MDSSNRIAELQKQIQDAENRIKEAERGIEKEQRRTKEADKRRIEEAERRAEKAERRTEKAERRAEKAVRRAEEAEGQIRPTTLDEYITAYHELVFSQLKLGNDTTLSLEGPVTNPRSKLCPKSLKPWLDFLQQQTITFRRLYETFAPKKRVFGSRNALDNQGERVSQYPMKDERTLEHFLFMHVEDPVNAIIVQLKKSFDFRCIYDIGKGVVFEDYPNAMRDEAEEAIAQQAASSPFTNQRRPTGMRVRRSDDEPSRRTMLYALGYKVPHKLTTAHLRLGLRSMNIYEEVVDRTTVPMSADPEGRFRYHAERLTVSALTEIYHYMITDGLEFGLLTTGEAMVFLKIDWEDPDTLYYHLAEPKFEAAAHPDNLLSRAAVSQYLAFSLMALGAPGQKREHDQNERERARISLRSWAGDFENILHSIPEDDRRAPDGSLAYVPTTHSTFDRSALVIRKKKRPLEADDLATIARKRGPPKSSNDESAHTLLDTRPIGRRERDNPNPLVRHNQRTLAWRPCEDDGNDENDENDRDDGDDGQRRQYCTQKCLLGLVNGDLLDIKCPNVASHGKAGDMSADYASLRHPVQHEEWLRLLSQQLAKPLDRGVEKLWIQGTRRVLFQVTMLAYGYTFVCKGTVQTFIPDLKHEGAVYERLKPVQGISVPVFLGAIDLRSINRTYYYNHRVDIIHMLSWGGQSLYDVKMEEHEKKQLEASLSQALRAIHQEGVAHENVRSPNILRNSETGGVMLIDFERAILLDRPRRPLGKLVLPNKRAQSTEAVDRKNGKGRDDEVNRRFANDRAMATQVFCI